jgi:hypothetical protein
MYRMIAGRDHIEYLAITGCGLQRSIYRRDSGNLPVCDQAIEISTGFAALGTSLLGSQGVTKFARGAVSVLAEQAMIVRAFDSVLCRWSPPSNRVALTLRVWRFANGLR